MKLGISITPTGKELLNEMAKQTKLSRSELIERISRGYISIKSELTNTILTLDFEAKSGNSDSGTTTGKFPALHKIKVSQSSELAEETSAQFAEILAEKDEKIAALEDRLKRYQNTEEKVVSLQQTLVEKEQGMTALESQLSQLQQRYEAIQAELLEEQQKESHGQTLAAQSNYEALEQQLQRHRETIANLQHQVQVASSINSKEAEWRSQLEEQQETILSLQSQMAQLQRLSAIGEHHLNRWKTHSF